MYICICNAITDSEIVAAAHSGHTTLKALRDTLGVAGECGRCARSASDLLKSCRGCGRCDHGTPVPNAGLEMANVAALA